MNLEKQPLPQSLSPASSPLIERQDSHANNVSPLQSQNATVLDNVPRITRAIPSPTKYQVLFPERCERALAPLDDAVVRVVQRRTQGALHMLVMSVTFFSAIEMGLTAPATLYALGYDRAAGLSFSVLSVLCLISQMPKKFIFRRRPWMSGRALPVRQDCTSSFPSRAVVCAVVFSWLIGQSLFREGLLSGQLSSVKLWLGIIAFAALTAFARINVGAHYASDTICGFILGLIIIRLGTKFEGLWETSGCGTDDMYPKSAELVVTNILSLRQLSFVRLFTCMAVSYAMTWVSIQGFWVKCSYVYGLLLSAGTFRAAFLCSGATRNGIGSVEQVIEHGSKQTHVRAIVTFVIFLLFGMATRGNKGTFRIVAFTVIYFGSLFCMVFWRLPGGRI